MSDPVVTEVAELVDADVLMVLVLAGEHGERSEPPQPAAAEGRLEHVRKAAPESARHLHGRTAAAYASKRQSRRDRAYCR